MSLDTDEQELNQLIQVPTTACVLLRLAASTRTIPHAPSPARRVSITED